LFQVQNCCDRWRNPHNIQQYCAVLRLNALLRISNQENINLHENEVKGRYRHFLFQII
jgi:hypothetical protein